MLNNLLKQPQDKILALMDAYKAEVRENKIDIGVGENKNESGATPIQRMILSGNICTNEKLKFTNPITINV